MHDPEPQKVSAEGRLSTYPGAEVTAAADFTGIVRGIAVKERDAVKRGQLLAEVRAEDVQAALEQAQGRVAEYDAEIKLARYEQSRAGQLLRTGVGSRQALDKAERDLDAFGARRAAALAETRRLRAVLNKARIVAPIDGVIIQRHIDAGEAVEPGTPVATIADLSRVRIEAEVDEFDVARVRLGDTADIKAEGYLTTWHGRVEEIPDNVATRRMKPQDPARPVDTRVLLIKIALNEDTPLKLGQRVEVSFNAAPPAAAGTGADSVKR
jgi:RND family efflux transporter MFP subunit